MASVNHFDSPPIRRDILLHLNTEAVMHVQARCCEIKSQIVEQDEREAGLRMMLNFGHTVGHALEAAGQYRALKHGEAVLLGMSAESFLAHKMGLLDSESFRRIEALVNRVPVKRSLGALKPKAILAAMGRDKKAVAGKKRFILPSAIGKVSVVEEVDPSLLQACILRLLGHRNS